MNTPRPRIAITGLGQISALGHDVPSFWAALKAGRSAIAPASPFLREHLVMKMAAEVKDYQPADHFEPRHAATLDRFAQFAVIAAREALAMAELSLDDRLVPRTAVIAGVGGGGMTTLDEAYRRLYAEKTRIHPMTIPRFMMSAAASAISMDAGARGPTFSVSSACSSGNHAIGSAAMLLRAGAADIAIAGGAEASFSLGAMKSWEALRVMAPDACRPFSLGRKGMVLGEGAGFLVLENWKHAEKRGAPILAEMAGFGFTADAGDLIQPSEDGASAAMTAALADAALAPSEIEYVNAHGTGTQLNDANEARALARVFGERLRRLPVSSTKSMHGHCLGATGGLEAVAAVLAIRDGVLPPTVNFTAPDPECPLDVVAHEARQARIGAALSNNFAFGGLNAVLAIRNA